MTDYLLISLLSGGFVIVAHQIGFLNRAKKSIRISKRALSAFSSKNLSDETKETLMTRYSILLMKQSLILLTFLLGLTLTVSAMPFLSPTFTKTLFSITGLIVSLGVGALTSLPLGNAVHKS